MIFNQSKIKNSKLQNPQYLVKDFHSWPHFSKTAYELKKS